VTITACGVVEPTTTTVPPGPPTEDTWTRSPAEWKAKGNAYYEEKQWNSAIECFTHGIEACSLLDSEDPIVKGVLPLLYNNRSECLFQMTKYRECIADCTKAWETSGADYYKPLARRCKTYCRLYECDHAEADYRQLTQCRAVPADVLKQALEELVVVRVQREAADQVAGSLKLDVEFMGLITQAIATSNITYIAQLLQQLLPEERQKYFAGRGPLGRAGLPQMMIGQIGHVGMLHLFVAHGMNPKALDDKGMTMLHIAAQKGHAEVVRVLVRDLGLDANQRSAAPLFLSPLDVAAQANQVASVRALVEVGANIADCNNPTKSQAIHGATMRKAREALRELERLGADPSAKDGSGRSVQDYKKHFW